jgi:hypothetical protein
LNIPILTEEDFLQTYELFSWKNKKFLLK